MGTKYVAMCPHSATPAQGETDMTFQTKIIESTDARNARLSEAARVQARMIARRNILERAAGVSDDVVDIEFGQA